MYSRFCKKTLKDMFLLVSSRHICAPCSLPTKLCKFFRISHMCNITQTWFLVRLFFYLSDSQFLYWMVCFFYFWWHDSKNRGFCHYYKASAMTKNPVKGGGYKLNSMNSPIKSARTDKAPIQRPPKAAAVGMYLLWQKQRLFSFKYKFNSSNQ